MEFARTLSENRLVMRPMLVKKIPLREFDERSSDAKLLSPVVQAAGKVPNSPAEPRYRLSREGSEHS